MARNYVAVPHEYTREMRRLTDEEFGRLIRALLLYSETGDTTEPEGNGAFLWERVMMQEDRFQESYEETVEARRESSRRAAAARWAKRENAEECGAMRTHADASAGNAENAINKTETETETETKTKTKTKTKTETDILPSTEGKDTGRKAPFAPPTAEEAAAYCREEGLSAEPEAFVDYYASKGWRVGMTPMEDWRAALRNWARKEQTLPMRGKAVSSGPLNAATPIPTPGDLAALERLERLRQKMTADSGRPPSPAADRGNLPQTAAKEKHPPPKRRMRGYAFLYSTRPKTRSWVGSGMGMGA